MSQVIDHIVKVSIQEAISSVVTVDVNTIAIVGKAAAMETLPAAGEYRTAKKVADTYGASSELAAMAETVFRQVTQPEKIVVIPVASTGSFSTMLTAVKAAAENFNFYHIVAASDDGTITASDITGTSGWEPWLEESHKMLHLQVSGASAAETLVGALKAAECTRVAVYLHTENWEDDDNEWKEFLNAAIVAVRCGKDSARGSFAHKKCSGVTADSYDVDDFGDLKDAGVNVYMNVSGEARLFFGTTCDNEHFIDEVVKDDWIRFNVQSKIFALLGDANDGYGVNYDDAGIAGVAAAVLNVLNVAADSDHQYVMSGSESVDYKPYSYLVANYAEDVRQRNLPLISGRYARMGSINTVKEVSLQVTL